ncbi:hypothetical protein ACFQNF_15850 [Iodobacter arcticus]|uniref:Lipoprotein n=1 Tax=Iodobacter arcticus TaxID=590593 RepID=A0ABW2R098_9NEIS
MLNMILGINLRLKGYILNKKFFAITSFSLCFGLTACGGGGGDNTPSSSPTTPSVTTSPPAVITPATPTVNTTALPPKEVLSSTVQRLQEGDMYSLHVETTQGTLGEISTLQTQMSAQGVITDDHKPNRLSSISPVFLHQVLSAHPNYVADFLDHMLGGGALDYLDDAMLTNRFNQWGKPNWLTHNSDKDRAAYHFRLEEIDLNQALMKNNLVFSTGEAKNGLLPISHAKLSDSLGDAKFPSGSVGLRTRILLPANKLLQVDNLAVKEGSEDMHCIYPNAMAKEGVALKLGRNTVEAFSVDNACKNTGTKLASGTFKSVEQTSSLGITTKTYLFNFSAAGEVERQLLSPTYQKANARLALRVSNFIAHDQIISLYFDKETEIIDPQLHFNKTAIDALKQQLGCTQCK